MVEAIPTDADILSAIDAFCAVHKLPPTTFGRMAVGDGNLLANLRAGRSPTLKLARRLTDFMAEYRPADQQAAAA